MMFYLWFDVIFHENFLLQTRKDGYDGRRLEVLVGNCAGPRASRDLQLDDRNLQSGNPNYQ